MTTRSRGAADLPVRLFKDDAAWEAWLARQHAKANGQWDAAYDSHRTARVPDDLQRALDAHPTAKAFFATLNSANRYAILFRVQTVKRAETRAKKIEQFVAMLERHEVIHSSRESIRIHVLVFTRVGGEWGVAEVRNGVDYG